MEMHRNYETLDAIVVVACLIMVSGLGAGLLLLHDIPTDHLPIISSLVTAILGLPIAYGAFRWGNNVGAKQAAEAAAESSKASTAALAQIAGASSPVQTTTDPAAN
jgi:hypothetical protein